MGHLFKNICKHIDHLKMYSFGNVCLVKNRRFLLLFFFFFLILINLPCSCSRQFHCIIYKILAIIFYNYFIPFILVPV